MLITALIAEIRENVQRYLRNAAQLKSLLYYMGDETFQTYPDWDWRWPDDVRLASVVRRRFENQRWRAHIVPQLVDSVDAFYALLADQPPSMETWAVEWRGDNNTFYIFIMRKLDSLCSDVIKRASDLASALQET